MNDTKSLLHEIMMTFHESEATFNEALQSISYMNVKDKKMLLLLLKAAGLYYTYRESEIIKIGGNGNG